MADYALVKNGTVENVIVWDGVKQANLDGDLILADSDARVGGTYDGAFHFVDPPAYEPTAEEIQKDADKASGNAKLKALGLTDAEIEAIT
tara:strand:- start:901 stop:1170 length:270 start_codon:yes stop_codon:yes gene_type:complete